MTSDKPLSLLINGNPPQEIIPSLIEWWLTRRKNDWNYEYAEIFQRESADVEDQDDILWQNAKVFIGNEAAPQNYISLASSKTGIINYVAEDAEGNPMHDPLTEGPLKKTLHSDNIRIYCCLPVSIANPINNREVGD